MTDKAQVGATDSRRARLRSVPCLLGLVAVLLVGWACGRQWKPARPPGGGFVVEVPRDLECSSHRLETTFGTLTGSICSTARHRDGVGSWVGRWFERKRTTAYFAQWFDLPASFAANDVPILLDEVRRRDIEEMRKTAASFGPLEEIGDSPSREGSTAVLVDGVPGIEYLIMPGEAAESRRVVFRVRLCVHSGRLYRLAAGVSMTGDPMAPEDPAWKRYLDSFHFSTEE